MRFLCALLLAACWRKAFAGQWCLLHTKTGLSFEGTVSTVTVVEVVFSDKLQVYNAIQGLRDQSCAIEALRIAVPLDLVAMLQVCSRQKAEEFVQSMNAQSLGLRRATEMTPIHRRRPLEN